MKSASISELQHFFEGYAECIDRNDARGIAQYFSVPCLMVSDDRSSAFTDLNAVEVLFLQGFSFLKKHGIVSAKPDVRNRRFITEKILQVAIQWSYFGADGHLLYACDYLYMLHHKEQAGWRIETSISVNEKERMEAFLNAARTTL